MKNTLKLAAVSCAALLAACGGGGSSSTGSTPTSIASPPPAPDPSKNGSLVTSVPAATYTGDFAAAFNLLNAERSRCGFGLLAQNAQLDAAAMAHASYIATTGTYAHIETAGTLGFTGVAPGDRAIAKGYPGRASSIGEAVAESGGEAAIRILLSAPYHLSVLTFSSRDIGIGEATSNIPGSPYFVADFGAQTLVGSQFIASSDVVTYPCNGTTGVNFQLRGETPNPVPGRDLSVNPIGTPILFKARDLNALVISNVSMTKAATGTPIALRQVITAANDPNGDYLASQAYVAPDAPLEQMTGYTVTYSGTNNGVAFTNRSFTFTTGVGGK